MVESLKKLGEICQKPRYKEVGNWMVRHILRDAALPITWLLLHTNISANQVTLISLLAGLFGIALFSFKSQTCFLLGAILVQLWYFLDHVDGQIARYRKTASLSGRFFDFMTHHIIHGVIFFSLGIYCFNETSHFYYVVLGFIASLCILLFNMTSDTKYKTFFEQFNLATHVLVKAKTRSDQKRKDSITKQIYSLLHKLVEIHVLMNILTVSAILQLFWSGYDLRLWLFWFYFSACLFLATTKITFLISRHMIDKEFNEHFKLDA